MNFFITGTFDIILCVDVIETTGGQAKSRKEALIPELKKNGMRWFVIGGSGESATNCLVEELKYFSRVLIAPEGGCVSISSAVCNGY